MIYILSWTTKKHQKTLSRPLHSKLKKIQGLFKDLHRNIRTFQGNVKGLFKDFPFKFKDFSRLCEPWNVTDSTYHKRESSKCDWAINVTRSTKVVLRDFLFFINLTISYLHMNNRNIITQRFHPCNQANRTFFFNFDAL